MEETVVVRKEVPVEEYETHVVRSNVEAGAVMRQESTRGYAREAQFTTSESRGGAVGATETYRVAKDSVLGQAITKQSSPVRNSGGVVRSSNY